MAQESLTAAKDDRLRKMQFMGDVEPHTPLLKMPAAGQLLYKIMTVEHLISSVTGSYMHLNRVDSYRDFSGADEHDGRQLPKDQQANASVKFLKNPNFSAAGYYDRSRSRSYACCFSLENSAFIWKAYGGPDAKVGVVFDLHKLRSKLNRLWHDDTSTLEYQGIRCQQIFSINYGIVEYVDRDTYQANSERLPNPIIYTYLKDNRLSDEKEFRISLSALGIGKFVLSDRSEMQFPSSLQLALDFRSAFADGTITELLCMDDDSVQLLKTELKKQRIVLKNQ